MTTVAVVDDDQTLLDLVAELLLERNWAMLAVRDGHGASEVLRLGAPDVILLDIRLESDQSGWDILDQLLADPVTRAIPVIVWTADANSLADKRAWLEDLGVQMLAKPFEIDDLFRALDKVLPVRVQVPGPSANLSA
jgi:CheY-like chemotaxis protein